MLETPKEVLGCLAGARPRCSDAVASNILAMPPRASPPETLLRVGAEVRRPLYSKPCRWTTYHSPRQLIRLVSSKLRSLPSGRRKRSRERSTRK